MIYNGKDRRMPEDHSERLVKLEVTLDTGLSSIGRSLDGMRSAFESHVQEEKELKDKLDAVERDFDTMKGGYRVFLKMCGFFAAFGTAVWAISSWVAKQNGG